ncbi:MAG: uroporphyrinogen-III synthase [Hyphomonadaceae bacterium]
MMLRVAVTRALPDAEATAARLRALGADAIVAPLLTIVPCGYDTNVEEAQALIFTSAAGVRAFPDARNQRARPVLAVGDATAEAARDAGFIDVRSADGDVAKLAALAKATLDPGAGKLIHIGGEHVAGDLSGELVQAGFAIERRTAYAAIAIAALPPSLRERLDIVLFHSARAAEAMHRLGAPQAEARVAACLSQSVAKSAAASGWKRIVVAPAPREDALLRAALEG